MRWSWWRRKPIGTFGLKIPLPSIPRWLDLALNWANADIGPQLGFYQPRRIDILGLVFFVVAISIDGMFFNGWRYALLIDPWVFVLGWMIAVWFI